MVSEAKLDILSTWRNPWGLSGISLAGRFGCGLYWIGEYIGSNCIRCDGANPRQITPEEVGSKSGS